MENNDVFDRLMNFRAEDVKKSSASGSGSAEKKVKPSERFLTDLAKIGFNMNQLETVLKVKGSQLIISCAGSGKTTALVFKIIYDLLTGEATKVVEINNNVVRIPESIWVCTFLKSGAEELGEKLSSWQRKLGVVDTSDVVVFSTLHAEFKRALTAMGVETNIINAADNSKFLKEVVGKYNLLNGDGRPMNSENLRDLESALIYTRNRLDGKRYDREIYNEIGISRSIIDAILRDWKNLRKGEGKMDFEDLQELLFEECVLKKNEPVIQFLRKRYAFMYIDEFQDTSQLQYELLKIYASGARQVVAIGDDDQTIYSWRGSYNGIITKQFREDFSPVVSELSLNFRCPSNILKTVIPSIEKNEDRYKKELKASRDGGEVYIGQYMNYKDMVESLCGLIHDDIKDGRTVAVLCRVNSDGLMPALLLDSMGKFSFTISGEGMTLDSYIGRMVIGIVRLFTDSYSSQVEKSLKMLTRDQYSVGKLIRVCKNNRVNIWNIVDSDLAYSCPDIYPTLKMWRRAKESQGDIFALKMVLEYYRTSVFKKETQFNRVCKSVILSMEALLSYNDYERVADFLDDLESINERLKARRKPNYGTKVKIATVHEFKGKEADSVYVWNDSKGVFPHKSSDLDDVEEFEEERRIHYIACTRARKRLTIMHLLSEPGDFIHEMDLSGAEKLPTLGIEGSISVKGLMTEEEKNFKKFEKKAVKEDDEWNIDEDSSFIDFSGKVKKDDSSSLKTKGFVKNTIEFAPTEETVDQSDRECIIEMYTKENMTAYEIQAYFEENGYDMYGYNAIAEVIADYERYHRD